MDKTKLATHDGMFHADEVNAYVILKKIFPNHSLVRSRDPRVLVDCDIVFDVGNGEFDHHAAGSLQFRENGIPYSSFGLIWREFGMYLLRNRYLLSQEEADYVFNKFDEKYVQRIDALDNGYETSSETYDIVNIVSGFHPLWDSEGNLWESQFKRAVDFTEIIVDNLFKQIFAVFRGKKEVKNSFDNRENKKILVLKKPCPWKEELLSIDIEEEVLFVIFPDETADEYRLQVVPIEKNSFEARKNLPAEWGGKRNEELGVIVGIEDAVFCHNALFIAGAKSEESIKKMASLAIQY